MTNDQLDELERLAKAATDTGPATLIRYEHGGGRLFIDGTRRELIADFFDVADREFYYAANPAAVLELIAAARRTGSEPTGNAVADAVIAGFLHGIGREPWDDMHDYIAVCAVDYAKGETLPAREAASRDDKLAGYEARNGRSETKTTTPPNAGEGLRSDIVAMFKDRGIEDIDEIDPEHDAWNLEEHLLLRAAQALRSNSPEDAR